MKYISKFNELVETKILSNDRVDEMLKDIETISSELDKDLSKVNSYIKELEGFTSKSSKSNTQIDNSYLAFKDIASKLEESIGLIVDINEKLESYKEEGEKFLD
jgi:phage-related protein